MDDKYITQHHGVLRDDHSFVHLVDSMPRVPLCSAVPPEPMHLPYSEFADWSDRQHCYAAVTNDMGVCDEHLEDELDRLHMGDDSEGVLHFSAAGDQRIVDAARVSIAGQGVRATSENTKLIHYLVKNRHTTPLEQVRFTFHVRLPLFCARQWIRHRTGSFNEESARYGKLAADFYIPALDRLQRGGQARKNKQGSGEPLSERAAQGMQESLERHSAESYARYELLLENGLARELARMVLPVNIYTQWMWTTDLHNLFHFLGLRLHPHAQWEMRQYAEAILPMARSVAPEAVKAWEANR